MSRRRTTFGKLQRDRDKQAKQRAKIERRQERAEHGDDDAPDDAPTPPAEVDQAAVLAQLADLHAAFDDGKISFDDFESRRDELTSKLRVD
ncbi:MAG TPA: hypothetical protein VFI47_09225 [Acidimicrobiales bacterium]|nr:hypothetical protein [Acidimicrobiales bacterium]